MTGLPPDHFLSLVRPDIFIGPPPGAPDTTTLAAHDFDVDNRTGFMPPQQPLHRLPLEWNIWETALGDAVEKKLQLGDKPGISVTEARTSEDWRNAVRALPILSTTGLRVSEVILRRAHHVLAWIMHFYIHSLPPHEPVSIPPPVTIPLLQVSAQLQLPPVITYSDDVLYNWEPRAPSAADGPEMNNLRCQTLFTGTTDEEEFYLASARIELRGVEVLELMRATMDEAFVGDEIAIRRITGFMVQMAAVIRELRAMLLAVRDGCDPEVFYRDIRPWFRGADSDPLKRKWVFEGLDQDPDLKEPTELSVFAFRFGHWVLVISNEIGILEPPDQKLQAAYNDAILALKEFRDTHMIIVTLYIVGPARRLAAATTKVGSEQGKIGVKPSELQDPAPLKGTGGTELIKFLKEVRARTLKAILPTR
ncbi:Indoleamine 2,3-dioxygenase [Infundibulicybe gibba]|nr:Indoleamine 2,3-dioxygenase [Infundibulicybe gibba]